MFYKYLLDWPVGAATFLLLEFTVQGAILENAVKLSNLVQVGLFSLVRAS